MNGCMSTRSCPLINGASGVDVRGDVFGWCLLLSLSDIPYNKGGAKDTFKRQSPISQHKSGL